MTPDLLGAVLAAGILGLALDGWAGGLGLAFLVLAMNAILNDLVRGMVRGRGPHSRAPEVHREEEP